MPGEVIVDVNPFDIPQFSHAQLTESINILPKVQTWVSDLGFFPTSAKGISTTYFKLMVRDHKIHLLPSAERGSPGTRHEFAKSKARILEVPHVPHEGSILPSQYQNALSMTGSGRLETLAAVMNEALGDMRMRHDFTHEWHLMNVLKHGQILDADGDVIEDLHEVLGTEKQTFSLNLANAEVDLRIKFKELYRKIKKRLKMDVMTHVKMPCDAALYDAIISHKSIKEAFNRWNDGALLRESGKGFTIEGVEIIEFNLDTMDHEGNAIEFMDPNKGIAGPMGTKNTFKKVAAPGDFLDSANKPGKEIYARQQARKFNKGIDIHTESNVMPYMNDPSVMVEVTP